MKYNLYRKQYAVFFLSCLTMLRMQSEPTRLNNADPYPLFTSAGGFDLLSTDAIRLIQEALDCDNESYGLAERLHISVMPFYQLASDGTDYRGNDQLTYYDNTNLPSQQSSAALAAAAATGTTPQPSSQVVNNVPMPLGAIPEAYNFFALFYPFNQNPALTGDNRASKILANALGYNHAEFMKATSNFPLPAICGCLQATDDKELQQSPCYDPLQYGYENFRNNYYSTLVFPLSRDPGRLFGYGYFDFDYQKYGVRSLIEFKATPMMGVRIYTGLAHLQQDRVTLIDTTTPYQGPTAATMFVRYPDMLDLDIANNPSRPSPYISPNIYQLSPYATSELNGDPTLINWSQTPLQPGGTTRFQNWFKSLYLQNIQNNYLYLAELLHINLSPYEITGFEDTTVEFYWRTMRVYNAEHKKESWGPYIVMPILKAHFTVPLSPQVPPWKLFAKPIANNGHWELGGSAGLVIDFLQTVTVGMDLGVSYFTNEWYQNMPVPTNSLQEGIYPYLANVERDPGINFTLGLGMNVDHYLDKVSFFGEYRLIRHSEDNFFIGNVCNSLPINMVPYLKRNNTTQIGPPPEGPTLSCYSSAGTPCDPDEGAVHVCSQTGTLPIVPKSGEKLGICNAWGTVPIPQNTAVDVVPGILYTDPVDLLPIPKSTDVYTQHLIDVSGWMVHLANFSFKFDIHENTALGFSLQCPLSVTNAYNSTTFSLSLETYF